MWVQMKQLNNAQINYNRKIKVSEHFNHECTNTKHLLHDNNTVRVGIKIARHSYGCLG